MAVFIFIMQTFLICLIELLYLFGVIIGVGFLLGFLEKYIHTYLIYTFGKRGILLTAWIGTPIHEIGHLIQCFIWGHQITRVKLLQLNDSNGVLGYVEHRYNPNSLYNQIGHFFIGIGPIFSGIGSIILCMYLFVPNSFSFFIDYIQHNMTVTTLTFNVYQQILELVLTLSRSLFTFENFRNPLFWMFIIVTISISSHIALSKQDIKGSTKGLVSIFIALFLIQLGTRFFGYDSYSFIIKLAEYNVYVLAFSSIAILFSLISLFICYILYLAKKTYT